MAASLQSGVTFPEGEAAWKLVLKGSASLALAVGAYCAGVLMVTSFPWFFKLLGYMIMGFAFFGLYDVAIGCSSVSSRRLFGSVEVSRIIGQVSLLVLLKPLQSLHVENLPEQGVGMCRRWVRKLQNLLPLSFSFNALMNSRKDKLGVSGFRIALQFIAVSAFACFFFPAMVMYWGWSGLVRFWLVPYLYMHFQMGTFRKDLTLKEQQRLAAKYSPYNVVKELFMTTFETSSKVVDIARRSLALEKRSQDQSTHPATAPTTSGSAFSSVATSSQPRAHWFNICYLGLVHAGAAFGISLLATKPAAELRPTLLIFLGTYVLGGLGITAGAHRLWAHRSYEATVPMRVLLMIMNSIANQGSILRWARDHRLHHKHVDTPNDPHDATRGFWYSHIGWLLWQKGEEIRAAGRKVHMDDLYADPVVMLQHHHYLLVSSALCYGLPTALGYVYGCAWTAYWVAGVLRYCCLLHATWMVNSAAHLWGYRPYLPDILPAENWLVSFFAVGEGWHNFHHAYPYDYSASEYGFWKINLTTGFLDACAAVGLLSARKKALPRRAGAPPPPRAKLPEYTMADVKACANQAAALMVVDGLVYDVTGFEELHPGGAKILRAYYGKDATRAFRGGTHAHTSVADNLLQEYCVGRLAASASGKDE